MSVSVRSRVSASFQNNPTSHWSVRVRFLPRLGSGVRVSASFQKIPHLVGRLWSGVWVSASFQKNTRLVGRLVSEPRFVGRIGQEYGLVPVFKFSLGGIISGGYLQQRAMSCSPLTVLPSSCEQTNKPTRPKAIPRRLSRGGRRRGRGDEAVNTDRQWGSDGLGGSGVDAVMT